MFQMSLEYHSRIEKNRTIVTMRPIPEPIPYTPAQPSPSCHLCVNSFQDNPTPASLVKPDRVSSTLHILMEHTPPLSRTVARIPTLSLAMRAHSPMFPLPRHRIDHRPRARSPHAPSLIVVSERVPGLSAMHLLVIPVIQLALNRPAPPPLLGNPTNPNPSSNLTIPAPPIRPRVRILQPKFLLLVVSRVISLVAYAGIPGFVRVQGAETAPIPPSSVCTAEGRRFVGTTGCALVAQRVPFVDDPALNA